MKRLFTLGFMALVFITTTQAQSVAINNNGAQANGSSILDVSSTTKGFLLPRMTAAQCLAITTPATDTTPQEIRIISTTPLQTGLRQFRP